MNKNTKNSLISEKITEIEKLLMMEYNHICEYLKYKYGKVPKSYFANDTYRSKSSGITRTKEGLFIHHIDEDKIPLLSDRKSIELFKAPFEYQMPDRLVYCNLLEHLVLHIKIYEINRDHTTGIGGIHIITSELNDIYSGIQYKQEWKQKVVEIVLPFKQDYLKCIKRLYENGYVDRYEYEDITFFNLKSSWNERYGLWKNEYNKNLYDEFDEIEYL